ncbi:MAG TPA: polysaccharide deacetylase family protein [Sphingobium sp.]
MIANDSLLCPPGDHQFVPWDRALGRRFMLFVDTEEEFDWEAPFDRTATQVTAMAGLARGQAYFAAAAVRPVYLVDYPIVQSDAAVALLGQWLADGSADVGAHLHPWVTPPHEEQVGARNSFAGNLPDGLEQAKLLAQCTFMEERLGRRPLAYRAGRYGVGHATAHALVEAGFMLDCSIRSRFDYSAYEGPDFSGLPLRPYRVGPDHRLIELPLSTAFTGLLRGRGEGLHRIASGWGRASGALSRAGLLTRVPLTPEGVTARECIAAIDSLIEENVPVLSFSFHSPTLEPGHTGYVRTAAELDAFYRWWDVVLDHLARRSIAPIGLSEFLGAVGAGLLRDRTCQAA